MRSDITKKGSQRSAHRSLFHAMGYTNEELQRPMIGVVNSFNEIVPGHMHLREIADAVKMGVAEAGGMPVEFPAIAICDGIAMGHDGMKYPLASRELIADSIEAVANGHAFDGLVMIPNCDKIVPGMAHGSRTAQHPHCRRQRRPHACRPLERARHQCQHHV